METISPRIKYVHALNTTQWLQAQYNWTRMPSDVWVADVVRDTNTQFVFDKVETNLTQQFEQYVTRGAARFVDTDGEYVNKRTGVVQIDNWQPDLADQLFGMIKQTRMFDYAEVNGSIYQLVGCSNHFFHLYCTNGGEHFPHVDGASVNCDGSLVKLMAVLCHWTTASTGELAIVNNRNYPSSNQPMVSWERQATDNEIQAKFTPLQGRVFVFPNDTCCHSVLPYTGDSMRISSRGDLLYRKVK